MPNKKLRIETTKSSELKKSKSKYNVIGFWRASEVPYGCMSQWYMGDITFKANNVHGNLLHDLNLLLKNMNREIDLTLIENYTFNCAEQFMMMGKVLLFDSDENKIKDLMKLNKPNKIKAFGRYKVLNFDMNDWDNISVIWVTIGNYLKFTQDLTLKQLLLKTHDNILVEASPLDKWWGVGLEPNDNNLQYPSKWQGENRLGEALMIVRELISM